MVPSRTLSFIYVLKCLFTVGKEKREQILRKLEDELSSEDESSGTNSEKELMVIEVSQKRYNQRCDYKIQTCLWCLTS